MALNAYPLVSVVTPVYNGEKYLAECIESVLAQTYPSWDYTIVNNYSTDRTLEIAQNYANRDARIRIQNNQEFVDIIENHNIAFRLISAESKYCKIVSADDWLFPECITKMVEIAEANPSVGIVGSYQLSGGSAEWCVKWDKVPCRSPVIHGREICRWHLLGKGYVFGTPTSILYRSDLVKGSEFFYPNSSTEADTSACYKYLQHTDFGFVHQVLSYERIHVRQVSEKCRSLNTYEASRLSDLLEYGPIYLTPDELERRIGETISYYYKLLAVGVVNFKEKEFWNYHKKRLEELGYPFNRIRFAKAVCLRLLDLLFNPKQSIEKMLKRLKAKNDGPFKVI